MTTSRNPSHLRGALKLLLSSMRGGEEAAGDPRGPRRRPALEGEITIDPGRLKAYSAVVGRNAAPAVIALAPPIFSSTWETAFVLELLALARIPFPSRGLVHVASEIVALRAIRANDTIRCRVEVERVEPHPRGISLTVRSRNWTRSGLLCQENMHDFLVRTGGAEAERPRPTPSAEASLQPGEESASVARWDLPSELGRRYASASGDYNPIHLWSWSARMLGYERPILHGFCTAAMVAEALATHLWNGDAAGLRRLRIHLRRPLLLPARVALRVVSSEPGRGRFEVADVDAGEGSSAYAEGEFVGGPA